MNASAPAPKTRRSPRSKKPLVLIPHPHAGREDQECKTACRIFLFYRLTPFHPKELGKAEMYKFPSANDCTDFGLVTVENFKTFLKDRTALWDGRGGPFEQHPEGWDGNGIFIGKP
jgi:hypothetical protein